MIRLHAATLEDRVSMRGLPANLSSMHVRARNCRQTDPMARYAYAQRHAYWRKPEEVKKALLGSWKENKAAGRSRDHRLPAGLPAGPLANAWRNTEVTSRLCDYGMCNRSVL